MTAALQRRAAAVRHTISTAIDARLRAVEIAASRWADGGPSTATAFEFEATQQLRQYGGYQAIMLVDSSGRVQASIPSATNRRLLALDVYSNTTRGEAFRRARATGRLALSQSYPLAVGGQGMIAVVPLGPDGSDGFLAAVFRLSALLELILAEEQKGAMGISTGGVALFEGDSLRFSTSGTGVPHDVPTATGPLVLRGVPWRLQVWPTDAWLQEMKSSVPEVALGSGITMSLLLTWALLLGGSARDREVDAALTREEGSRALAAQRARLIEEIEDERSRLAAVVQQLPLAVIIGEAPSGRLLLGNAHVERVFGHQMKPAEEIGQYQEWVGYHPDGTRVRADEWPLARAVAHGEVTLGQLVRYPRPGEPSAWIRLTAGPIRDRTGAIIAGVVATEDVTAQVAMQQALSESEDRFRAIFEQGGVAVALADRSGRFLRVNDAFCSILGYSEEEMLALSFRDVTHPDDVAERVLLSRQLLSGEVPAAQREIRYVRKDGEPVWLLLTSTVVRDAHAQPAYFISQMQDLTTRKEDERRLASQAAELQRSNEELEQFAYAASHDLQEPLRMVTSFTNLLARRYGGQLDDTARQYIHYAVDGATRMKQLIEDLLAYSRVGSHGRPFGPVDLAQVVADVTRVLTPAIEESGARVLVGEMPQVWADPMQVAQVFQNLIGNALKFRRPDTPPTVQIEAERQSSMWRFSVRDNGIGIDPQYADRIFIMFQRLQTRDDYPGTGIGLTLCKRIIERHGGSIEVQSAPGRDTTFYFTLPAIPAPDGRPPDSATYA